MRSTRRALGRSVTVCLLVGAVMLLVAACGGSGNKGGTGGSTSSQPAGPLNGAKADVALGTAVFGTLPSPGTAMKGGTITQGQLDGETPTYLFPIVSGENVTSGTLSFIAELYMPLYAGPAGAEPKVDLPMSAAAAAPVPSNGDRTYTIHLKHGLKWSDGKPITANDFLFFYYLCRAAVKESAAAWAQYVPGQWPMDVTKISAPNSTTVVMTLNKPYNPGYFLNNQISDTDNVYPLPSTVWNVDSAHGPHLSDWKNPAVATKIYNYLNKQGGTPSTFASNPLWKVVSGPFNLKSFSVTNSSYVLTPNPSYGGSPKSAAGQVNVDTYTSFTAELNALRSGQLDIMVVYDPSQLGLANSLKSQGIDVFGGPAWGWFGAQFNFDDDTNDFDKVISQQYVRAAMDYMVDQPAIIKGIYKGAAVTAYGPTPSAPVSPYAPASATKPPYPYSPAAGAALLKSHGWHVVPNGTTTCAKPGTGAGECGAGIPKGTPIKFVWGDLPSEVSSTSPLESEAFASVAKKYGGIDITFATKPLNFLASQWANDNPAGQKNHDDWGVNNYGGVFEDYYPTQAGIEDYPGTGLNTGSYSTPEADKLINASVHGGNINAVKTEAAFFEKNLPLLYFPDQDYLLAVNTKKVGSQPDGWLSMTQEQWEPNYWYEVK
jgi:peptide/nickel transport system substrate-binding protein